MKDKENSLLTRSSGKNANYIYEDEKSDGPSLKLDEPQISELVRTIKSRFQEASDAKRSHEDRMIKAYDAFRGIYGKNVRFRDDEKSRVFIKITKTKVLAAYGQIIDIVLGGSKFPIGIHETEMPEGTHEYEHLPSAEGQTEESTGSASNPMDVGYEGDGKVLPPGSTFKNLKDIFSKVVGKEPKLKPGPAVNPQDAQRATAKEASRRMEKLVHDQLDESNAIQELCKCIFEMCLFGTGIIQGPFTYYKQLSTWVKGEDGKREYLCKTVKVPRIEFVSIWDAYPDKNATSAEECLYFIRRRKFNRSQLRALARQPLFNEKAIDAALEDGPNYVKQSFESSLKTGEESGGRDFADRYELLEYWGTMDAKSLREVGLDIPDSVDNLDELQINAWICGDHLLRAAINPFKPARIPYQSACYEENPYSFFGIGVPENMEDAQQIINAHSRMAIDNLALSGHVIFDVDESALVDGQDMKMYPGKIFRRQSGMPGQAIYPIQVPNTTQQNMAMVDKFRQFADESTGLPSYSHGQTGIQSTTRTAAGMSMLMGAASLNIKTVVKSLDFLIKRIGEGMYHWNMQFYEGDLLDGIDLEVKALGTASIMQKEVRSQRLTMLLNTVANPAIAPYVKLPTLIKEMAYSLDLDPKELLNNTDEARIAAAIMGQLNGQTTGGNPANAGAASNPMGGSAVGPGSGIPEGNTGTGNGTIGTGLVPMAGEPEFSGNI
jgi:hypothetical protein